MTFMRKILQCLKMDENYSKDCINKIEHSKNSFIKSQYSDMPRYFTINGVRYDIDNSKDILKLPVFPNTFLLNDKEFGMDSVLRKHAFTSYLSNKAIYNAAQSKLDEYKTANIYFETEEEKVRRINNEEYIKKRELNELAIQKLHDSYKIDDMYQFIDIPFEWNWVIRLNHTNGIAWFMLNKNNQYIALKYIDEIDRLIISSHDFVKNIEQFEIFAEEIDFGYPASMRKDSLPNTYLECTPYTKTGKLSKYPVLLHFASSAIGHFCNGEKYHFHPYKGVIKIMQDGNIGSAHISFCEDHTRFSFGLFGINLIIKRIDSDRGNLYKFNNEQYD